MTLAFNPPQKITMRRSRGYALLAAMPLCLGSLVGSGIAHAQAPAPLVPGFRPIYASAVPKSLETPTPQVITASSFVVNTVGDPTTCSTTALSLRCAISRANHTTATGAKSITFAITPSSTACAPQSIHGVWVPVCTLLPTRDLPAVTASQVTINGYSQSGGSPNTNGIGAGDNAVITVRIDGSLDTNNLHALTLMGAGDVLEGVSVTGWPATEGVTLEGVNDVLQGDFIGLTSIGAAAGNAQGGVVVPITSVSTPVQIGGTTAAARNVISGNGGTGVNLEDPGSVQGNLIGTTVTGTAAQGNAGDGILLFGNNGSLNASVGGPGSARNVISGNAANGVDSSNDSGTIIAGNLIGTNARGTAAVPNAHDGVVVAISNRGEHIGGRNIIAGNGGNGVELEGSSFNKVEGNFIGVTPAGVSIPNGGNGVFLHSFTAFNAPESGDTIGDVAAGAGNTIANNAGNGVLVGSLNVDTITTGISIRGNSISNNPFGIALNGEYPTSCTLGPASGPNDYAPCPTVQYAIGTSTPAVGGSSLPFAVVDIYKAVSVSADGGYGEGKTYIATTTADHNGNWALNLPAGTITGGDSVTATATIPNASTNLPETSEFAANVTAIS